MDEVYNLTWHTYSDHLRQFMLDIKHDDSSQDVTLVCDDKAKLKAHRLVLKACSPVFASMLEGISQPNPVIYLRGIHQQEMESILKFMYLGEATFHQDKMNAFLNVARSLEVKELSEWNLETPPSYHSESDETESPIIHESNGENENIETDSISQNSIVPLNEKSTQCSKCNKQFASKGNMIQHFQSVHEEIKYPCKQCDYEATQQGSLQIHILSQHDGVKFPCSQCDYKATQQIHLRTHIKNKHEGTRYPCSFCGHKATTKSNLNAHLKSRHPVLQ